MRKNTGRTLYSGPQQHLVPGRIAVDIKDILALGAKFCRLLENLFSTGWHEHLETSGPGAFYITPFFKP